MNFLKTLLIVPLLLSSQIFAGHHEESKVSQKTIMNNINISTSLSVLHVVSAIQTSPSDEIVVTMLKFVAVLHKLRLN